MPKEKKIENKGDEGQFASPEPFRGYGSRNFKTVFTKWGCRKVKKYRLRILASSHSNDFLAHIRKKTKEFYIFDLNVYKPCSLLKNCENSLQKEDDEHVT